jgi:hypothetical protein
LTLVFYFRNQLSLEHVVDQQAPRTGRAIIIAPDGTPRDSNIQSKQSVDDEAGDKTDGEVDGDLHGELHRELHRSGDGDENEDDGDADGELHREFHGSGDR